MLDLIKDRVRRCLHASTFPLRRRAQGNFNIFCHLACSMILALGIFLFAVPPAVFAGASTTGGSCAEWCWPDSDKREKMCEWEACKGCTNCYSERGVVYSGLSRRGKPVSLDVRDCDSYSTREEFHKTMGNNAPFMAPPSKTNFWNEGSPEQKRCKANSATLAKIDSSHWFEKRDGKKINLLKQMFRGERTSPTGMYFGWQPPFCWAQHSVCMSSSEVQQQGKRINRPECAAVVQGCRAALRHLHSMMFRRSASQQVCNNFALKSIRGFFHDSVSSWVEGSVLHELGTDMNIGLCRWGQYISVLSEETQCDPGSVISMAAFLGFQACGVDIFDHKFNNQDALLPLQINKPYPCKANVNPAISHPATHPLRPLEKREKFSDRNIMARSGANEAFWSRLMNNTRFWSRYYMQNAVTASTMAHNIGRVTCPVGGDNNAEITTGFWDKKRTEAKGEARLRKTFKKTNLRLRGTQCDRGRKNCRPMAQETCDGLVRQSRQAASKANPLVLTRDWKKCIQKFSKSNRECDDKNPGPVRKRQGSVRPPAKSETNANVEAGFCNMPLKKKNFPVVEGIPQTVPAVQQFPMWKSVYGSKIHVTDTMMFLHAHDRMGTKGLEPARSKHQLCGSTMQFSLAYEVSRIWDTPLPVAKSLRPFEQIAWDGVGTINSAWDSCRKGCALMPEESRMCGGPGLVNMGNFTFVAAE